MNMELETKCALITGSIGGLGYTIAEHLAKSGCDIVLHGLEQSEEAQAAAERLRAQYRRKVLISSADLTRVEQIENMMQHVSDMMGGIDIVVNNAVVRHLSPTETLTTSEWEESLAVNLSSAFHIARLAIPGMRARQWGRIINMSSVYGSRGTINRIGYVTTKTALIGMSRAIALETASTGITCNAVSPGTVPTPAIMARIVNIAKEGGLSEAQAAHDYLRSRQPTGRFVDMHNVAALVLFLCSDAGQDITGSVFPIDGGWTAG